MALAAALLIITLPQRRAAPEAAPSPWAPVLLRVLAVITGLAGGILMYVAGRFSSSPDEPMPIPLAVVAAVLTVSALVLLLVVPVRVEPRGRSRRTPLLPGLSAADRRRARDTAAAPVALYCAAVVLAPWLPPSPLIWVPVAVAFALGLPLWAWWVTRVASTRDRARRWWPTPATRQYVRGELPVRRGEPPWRVRDGRCAGGCGTGSSARSCGGGWARVTRPPAS